MEFGYPGMIIIGYIVLVITQYLLWLRQCSTQNATSADVGWTLGMLFLVWWYAENLNGYWLREALALGMITIWASRLSYYLIIRAVNEDKEDSRYARFRKKWQGNANKNFFFVYQMQPVINILLSIPFLIALSNPAPEIHLLEVLGCVIWIIGLSGESIADFQLNSFLSRPENKGKICQDGLWNYSRHPNFFFEWVMWVAYFVYALSSPGGIWAVSAPLLMLFLLMKVTGIPVIEKYALEKKGKPFADYMKTTSFFIPLPKRSM